jgi:hypothetical protein
MCPSSANSEKNGSGVGTTSVEGESARIDNIAALLDDTMFLDTCFVRLKLIAISLGRDTVRRSTHMYNRIGEASEAAIVIDIDNRKPSDDVCIDEVM